jgi:hypothetical protein
VAQAFSHIGVIGAAMSIHLAESGALAPSGAPHDETSGPRFI